MKLEKKTLTLLKVWLIVALSLSFFVLLGYVYFKTPVFTVFSYELEGVPDTAKDKLVTHFKEIASQRRLKIFPGNRIIGYDALSMKEGVVSILPNTQSVRIVPSGLHTLSVRVEHYHPLFKFDETRGITKEGVIYMEFGDMSALPRLSIGSSTIEESINESGIRELTLREVKEGRLEDVAKLMEKINTTLFIIRSVYIDPYGDVTLFGEGEASAIIYSQYTNIEKVWSNLVSAIDTEPLKSKLADSKQSLEYLDARFGNKVFYKFTNAKEATILKDHDATSTSSQTIFH